jgi:uncharacterized membrane protein YdjX (TVP38/TMEM64 family)
MRYLRGITERKGARVDQRQATGRRRIAVAGLVLVLVAALVAGWFGREWLTMEQLAAHHAALDAWREAHFLAVLMGFFALYVLAALVSVPGIAMLSLLGGYLFGGLAGAAVVVAAATLGATGLYLTTRAGLGARLISRWQDKVAEGRFGSLADGLRDNEVKALLLLRLAPVVPFFVANALPAVMGVGMRNFVLTTAVGIMPGTLLFTTAGGGLAKTLAAGGSPELSVLAPFLLVVPAVLIGGVLAVRILRRD